MTYCKLPTKKLKRNSYTLDDIELGNNQRLAAMK